MERLDVTYIDPIDDRDLSIILDCEISDSSGNSVPLNDVSVVISVFDTTDNFIKQEIIDGSRFNYNFSSEEELLNYIYNVILDIDNNENLNAGIYRLRFSFILDTFNTIDDPENKFIVTEISPDGTEIRLNPLSNDTDFINTFSRLKDYKRNDRTIELTEKGFVEFYRSYVNSVFSDSNISDIFSDTEVSIDGMEFSEYLKTVYYNRSDITNENERLSSAEEKANEDIDEMKSLLLSKKGDAVIFISQYFESIKDDLFQKLNNTSPDNTDGINTIISEFKMDIKNRMEIFINDSVDEIIDLVLKN